MIGNSVVRKAPGFAGAFLCLALLLGGCATPQMQALQDRWPTGVPAVTQIANVPFHPQEEYQCGPASLAMAAGAAGIALDPEALAPQLYVPGRKGSFQVEMLAAARRQGLVSYQIRPQMEALLREVAAGHPVIVLQNLSLPVSPVWHYAVVTGFNRHDNMLVMHSGRTRDMEVSLYTFERTWARGGHWAMVALPPNKLPATAEADAFAASLAALEHNAPKAAQQAYRHALATWPGHRTLLLGAGNSAYTLGDIDAAARAYRTLVEQHPDFADGWNNLAQALLEQGRADEAATAIRQAVTLGGSRLPRYLELQQKIASRQRAG